MKRIKEEFVGTLFDIYDPIPTAPTPTTTATLYVACSRNEETRAGGWAAIVVGADGQARSLTGGEDGTTSYRLEVVATVTALKTLEEPTLVRLVTGDEYLFNGMTKWLRGWVENGWGKIKHQDVWQQAAELLGKHTISPERIYVPDRDPLKCQCQQMARSKAAVISYYE